MTRDRVLLGLFAILSIAGTTTGVWFLRRGPTYEGKSLRYWLQQQQTPPSLLTFSAEPSRLPGLLTFEPLPIRLTDEADRAVHAIGMEAIPTLVDMLCAREFSLRRALRNWLPRQLFFRLRLDVPETGRETAMAGFLAVGSNALPTLITLLKEKQHRLDVIAILSNLNPDARAVPLLLECLGDNPLVRAQAAKLLGRIGAKPEVVVPALITNLTDKDVNSRASAAMALGQFGSHARSAIPDLIDACRFDLEPEVQHNAAFAILVIGEEHPLAIETLPRDLNHPFADGPMRHRAAFALSRLSSPPKAVSEALYMRLVPQDKPPTPSQSNRRPFPF